MSLYPLSRSLRVVFYYNLVSTTLWFCCLCRLCVLLPLVGRRFLPAGIADFFHVVATLPLVGFFLVHLATDKSATVDSLWGLFNGLRMVWICYGVIFPHPTVAKHTTYSVLIVAWCWQNIIDSAYHSFKLKTKTSPKFLFFLHYNHFFVTFPLAFVSELCMVFLSLSFVGNAFHEWVLKLCFLVYVPVAFYTFKHLRARRQTKYVDYLEKRASAQKAASATSSTNLSATSTATSPAPVSQ